MVFLATCLVGVAACTGAEPKAPEQTFAAVPGNVTLTPSGGTVHGGNVVMVGLSGVPGDLTTARVEAKFGAAESVACEYDQLVRQFACRAPRAGDPVVVNVVVRANGSEITPAVPYAYTTGGYEDMPPVVLDLTTLQRNASTIEAARPTGVRMGIVLKNGDPVGAIGKAIIEATTVDYFFVPKLADGIALREAGVVTPVAIMYLTDPADIPLLLKYNLEVAATSAAWVERANAILEGTGGELTVHLWIDTGLGREGVIPEEALPLAELINRSPKLKLRGIATHLCCVAAEDRQALETNDSANTTVQQKTRFDGAVAQIRAAGIGQDAILHVGASDVLANDLEPLYYDMLRVGGMVFVSTAANGPLYSWKSRIDLVKTLPEGWCIDYTCATVTTRPTKVGLLSHIPAREAPIAFVVRGKTAPVLLNHSTVVTLDLSDIPDAVEGDEVTIQFNPANGQLLDTTLPVPVTLRKG